MNNPGHPKTSAVEIVLPCTNLEDTLQFFVSNLGFLLESIFPADRPRTAVISKQNLLLRLNQSEGDFDLSDVSLNIPGTNASDVTTPNGLKIVNVQAEQEPVIPTSVRQFVFPDESEDSSPASGRAGMSYRDLIPGRLGGFVIASHIRIPGSGPVPDYVHHHRVSFQIIYCLRGSAMLVYQDQGKPFLFEPGDCVLQPPGIRHRVLESFDDLEVLEVSSPAEHITYADNDMDLPNATENSEGLFEGQRFVRSSASEAVWNSGIRDTMVGEASKGAGHVRVFRPDVDGLRQKIKTNRLLFLFVQSGACRIRVDDALDRQFKGNDAVLISAGSSLLVSDCSADFELIEVGLGTGAGTHTV
jgi:uncharacterized protein YjlB